MPSTSWQWDPDTKQATCCYCGFTTGFAGNAPGQIDHDCDPTKHPPLTARQGLPIGRSLRPEAAFRVPLAQLLTCIHRGAVTRLERCATCNGNVLVKVFACAIHDECQLDDRIPGVNVCAGCSVRLAR